MTLSGKTGLPDNVITHQARKGDDIEWDPLYFSIVVQKYF